MKKILLACILFIFSSVLTQAQGTVIYLPLVFKSATECELTMENGWSFIQPVESTNYVLNPSAEAAGNYASLAGATITRTSTYQKYGRYSYRVQTGANGQGLSLTLSALTNSVHFATARIRGQLPVDTRFIIGTGLKTPLLIEKIDDNWSLYGVEFNASESNGQTELRIIQQGNGIGDFYVDGVQVEPLPYWTTYIDGTQEGSIWNGPENASTSTRSGLSLAGGKVMNFYDDYGFLIEKVIGASSASQDVNIDKSAVSPGGELKSIKVLPRDMSIVGKFIADNEVELHDKQQALHLALSSENYPDNQSFKLRFSGARVQKEIKANYKGGLEGDLNAFYCDKVVVSGDSGWETLYKWIEKASIQLQAPDPYWYETGESARDLDTNDSATFRLVAGRLKSTGQWSNLGPPNAAGTYTSVLAIAEDDTYIYFGGNFLNFDNIANADYIVRRHKFTGAYSALGTGANDVVRGLAVAADGTLYAVGSFTSIGGVATDRIAKWSNGVWSQVGGSGATGGVAPVVNAVVIDHEGNVHVTGAFTSISGMAIAGWGKYNGIGWSQVQPLDAAGFALALAPDGRVFAGGGFTKFLIPSSGSLPAGIGYPNNAVYTVAINPDGFIYVGGLFTLLGTTAANYIGGTNESGWQALGSGANAEVYSIAIGYDGAIIAGGRFTSMGGRTTSDRVARWNGSAWAHLDIDLPGSPTVYQAFASKYVDPVVDQKYDVYLGFDTTGTGNFAGKTTVTNEGNALAFPIAVFKRTGGTTITLETLKNENTGKELLFDYSLLDGEKLTIDTAKKTIVSSIFGPRLDAILPNSDFGTWALRPGDSNIACFAVDNFALYPSSLDAYLLWKDKYKSYN